MVALKNLISVSMNLYGYLLPVMFFLPALTVKISTLFISLMVSAGNAAAVHLNGHGTAEPSVNNKPILNTENWLIATETMQVYIQL